MEYKLQIRSKSQWHELTALEGTNLHRFLHYNDFEIYAPCNGHGTCGKCMVRLGGQNISEPTQKDLKFLDEALIAKGFRLACQTIINSDMEVYLDESGFEAKVLTAGKQKSVTLSPLFSKEAVTLPPPSLEDQRSDSQRLTEFLGMKKEPVSLELLRQLPDELRREKFKVTLVYRGNELSGIEAGDTCRSLYGIGMDIGTTTLAAYLIDLNTGNILSTYSSLNPQKKYGADVISRIKYTMEEQEGLLDMHKTILDGINLAVSTLAQKEGLNNSDIYEIAFVGNTTMMHFLLRLSARNIAAAPFIPAATQSLTVRAASLGININPAGSAIIVPSVAAYIGADTVSAVLASGMDKKEEVSLLIDFGTNGEIVLGNKDWLFSCSAAAGPAFEGANIRCGVGGINGAIDSVSLGKDVQYTTINSEKPVGICGTGVVDIVSELYKAGIIDETGRLEDDADELVNVSAALKARLTDINGMAAFIIADGSESMNGSSIVITQKDVRELQNAKAAIAAGIRVLVKRAGIGFEAVKKVYMAGGFGTYINVDSALNIGLIPAELSGKVEAIGNAAGIGATQVVVSKHKLTQANTIQKSIKYIELSSCKEFNDFFVEAMMFSED